MGEISSLVVLWLLIILSVGSFGLFLTFIIKYIIDVFNYKNEKAEKSIAYTGYSAIVSMIILFVIYFLYSKLEFYHELDGISFYGLFALILGVFIVPFTVIADIKQLKWIKSLSVSECEAKNISMKDRKPLIIVIVALTLINLALIGINLEYFITYII